MASAAAGNRLAEVDSGTAALVATRYQRMSYTALNQLHYSASNTVSPGYYDFNWHWYDAEGLRAKTLFDGFVAGVSPTFNTTTRPMTYYVYDGAELALTIYGQNGGYEVRRRFVSLGLDGAVAGRFFTFTSGTRSLALLTDHQGSVQGALRADGARETAADVYSRDAFGQLYPGQSGAPLESAVGSAYAGGSTPNASGGFTYFRNRWYDPSTGRFLTQDPIGLAGGVNLYAYAGNNPVGFSDPWGLDSVMVACRGISGGEKVGTHCAVRIQNENVDETYELLNVDGKNQVGVAGADQVARYDGNWSRVDTPEGMTELQHDNAARGWAQQLASERNGKDYSILGFKNSNRYVYDVVTKSGGKVPFAAVRKHPGIAPGICGGLVLGEGHNCANP